MVNMLGQVVLEQSVTPLHGMLSYNLNIDLLARGTYILHLKSGGYLYESHKIIKD